MPNDLLIKTGSKRLLAAAFVGLLAALSYPTQARDYWPHTDLAEIPVRIDRHAKLISMPVTLDGKQITAWIDTGAPYTVISTRAAEQLFGLTPDSARGQLYLVAQDYERALADADRAIQLDPNFLHFGKSWLRAF